MGSILEWEENIFLGLKALYRRIVVTPRDQRIEAVRARLDPIRQELFILARMVAGRTVPIIETPTSTLCDGDHLFLPPEFSAADSPEANEELYRLKTLLGALALRRGGLPRPGQALSEQIESWAAEFPGLPDRIAASTTLEGVMTLWTLFGEPSTSGTAEREVTIGAPAADHEPQAEEITEVEGRGQIGVKAVEDPGEQSVESEMPLHTFEKAETLEESSGLDRKTDEDDELAEHEEALRSLNMTEVMRTRERPRSIYRADMVVEGLSLEVNDGKPGSGQPYPEWDYKLRRHKTDWCFVQESAAAGADEDWVTRTAQKHRGVILDLRKKIAALATQSTKVRRQRHGDDLDLDAVVRSRVDLLTGQAPDERIYVRRQRRLHDVSALILMDLSFSTDSWIDDARVLDTLRETLFCTGEVLEEFIESFAVAGFSSNTRRQCGFHLIKNFHEPWRTSRNRLGGLEAQGYTRIGPALRHAQELLAHETATRKIVFLLTDGRPCDYDRYEGEYGIRDVRKAIETGAQHGIVTHAFAIEKRAREQFPRMFKRHHYDVVPSPKALVASLCGAFARLRLES